MAYAFASLLSHFFGLCFTAVWVRQAALLMGCPVRDTCSVLSIGIAQGCWVSICMNCNNCESCLAITWSPRWWRHHDSDDDEEDTDKNNHTSVCPCARSSEVHSSYINNSPNAPQRPSASTRKAGNANLGPFPMPWAASGSLGWGTAIWLYSVGVWVGFWFLAALGLTSGLHPCSSTTERHPNLPIYFKLRFWYSISLRATEHLLIPF
jgi:hypothetical protein